MRRIVAVVWLVLVAAALAALIHVTDAGIDGIRGLWSAKALPSLVLLAMLLTGLEAPSLIAFVRRGWKGLGDTFRGKEEACVRTYSGRGGQSSV